MSSADEIRAKRLARLNAGTDRQRPPPTQDTPTAKAPEPVKAPEQVTQSEPTSSPKPQTVAQQQPLRQQELVSTESPQVHLSKWLSLEIKSIFGATLTAGDQGIFLETLALELGSDPLTEDHLEGVFMEVLTDLGLPSPYKTTIEYLYSIYHAAFRAKRTLPVKSPFYQEKIAIINKIISFSTSYGFICFQIPDMFLQNNLDLAIDIFIKRYNVLTPFLIDIVKSSIEQESLLDLLNAFLPALSSRLYKLNLNDATYVNYITLLESLVSLKPVAAIFSQVNGFQPPQRDVGLDFENKTLLGSFLRLSPLHPLVAAYYFPGNASNMPQTQIKSTYESIQNEYKVVCDRLFFIVDKLIRGSAQTRTDLLTWFAELINLSHLRRGSHADFAKLPSDGIMYNITIILVKLSLPFMDHPSYSKIDKIDIDYFAKSKLIDVTDESRVNSSIQEADEEYKVDEAEEVNFISHCFYLTLSYLQYGVGGVHNHFERIKRQIKQFTERIAMIQGDRLTNPMLSRMLPTLLKSVNELSGIKHSVQALFSYRPLQLEIFDFIVGSTTFITKLIDPNHTYPATKLSIPIYKIEHTSQLDDHDFLKTKTPKPWKYYPEFILEGIINYCKFSTNFPGCPLVFNQDKLQLFVEFAIILLRCPELIGNPHMKSNLIELIFIGSLPMSNGEIGFIASIFSTNKLVLDNILYSLLDFYVMVEKTGSSSQFYDKFNSRYYISSILEELWKIQAVRKQLTEYSRTNVEFFVRFIARMLNDTTYLLDETFSELNSIHNYQQELKSRAQGNAANEEYGNDEELAEKLNSSEGKAKSYMQLSHKTMELFKLFTKEVPQGFVLPEIVDRLASMLDYNLAVLVGPKCSNLKVENPEKYSFTPIKTLTDLCEIYKNLSKQEKFVIAVSRDGRSFKLAYFEKAARLLSSKTYTAASVIDQLVKFAKRAEEQRLADENEELELGEVPDEFLDPLMYTLMVDPVKLPSSKLSIDRSTIKAHLLSDGTDPFNRVPLKLEDVIDDVELKQKIESWILEMKAQRLKEREQEDTVMEE